MKKVLISTIISFFAVWTVQEPNIIGTWESKTDKGNTLTGVFKADSTYEGFMNNKMFTTGTYSFKDYVVTFENDKMTECSNTKGSYKIFFLADTIMRLNVINDSCTPRNKGTDGVVFVRVKE